MTESNDLEELHGRPIEWAEDSDGGVLTRRDGVFLLGVAALAATFVYDYTQLSGAERLVGDWNPQEFEWLFVLSLLIFGLYVIVPLIQKRELTRQYWRKLRTDRLALFSLAWLTLLFALGLLAPLIYGTLTTDTTALHNPPFGFRIIDILAGGCAGTVSNGYCHGSLAHPLGTTGNGEDVLAYTVTGMRVALAVTLITGTIIVPLGVAVGTIAATAGGRVDEILMRYVDLQQTVPAFFAYILVQYIYYPSLLLIIIIFGLLNWGGLARHIRSDVLRTREAGFVRAAKSAGIGQLQLIRRHLVPNTWDTVVTAATFQLPMLVIMEATLSYLMISSGGGTQSLGDPRVNSWGQLIAVGMREFPTYWWVPVIPAITLLLTVVAISRLGDTLRDVLDLQAES
ncbi:MAG: ABC transporter permease [Halolamina sp.]|uniref:ABC transporter permease n=1 Tax=Halolamina sp. TaxID=1940283 RepID=UPI002FC3C282